MDGLEVCRAVRATSTVPILMLTARDDDVDKIVGLEVGADDYLTKPFNPRELVARIRSILRRATAPPPVSKGRRTHGRSRSTPAAASCSVDGAPVQLAPKEFDLFWELLDHSGLVLTRDQLLERVWGYTFAGDTRTVDVHVRQLRRKIGDDVPDRDRLGCRLQGCRRCLCGLLERDLSRSSWSASRSLPFSSRRSRCGSSRRRSARAPAPS